MHVNYCPSRPRGRAQRRRANRFKKKLLYSLLLQSPRRHCLVAPAQGTQGAGEGCSAAQPRSGARWTQGTRWIRMQAEKTAGAHGSDPRCPQSLALVGDPRPQDPPTRARCHPPRAGNWGKARSVSNLLAQLHAAKFALAEKDTRKAIKQSLRRRSRKEEESSREEGSQLERAKKQGKCYGLRGAVWNASDPAGSLQTSILVSRTVVAEPTNPDLTF